ncbi:unnamed protein product [Acidithrix sp. C25]|nr:unnamed protein product [Acidithrix sp. C25]
MLGLLSRNESLIEAINARKEVLSELLASSKRPELNRPLAVDIHA